MYAGLTPYDDVLALVADDGETFASALRGPSGLLDGVAVRDGFPPPAAYVELHIEQGPVMERDGARLGIVSVIAGQRRFRVVVDGVAGHAGTVPMAGRADALCAASEIVLAVERAALEAGDTVATVGHLVVEPNQTNIVPGRVVFRIDLRSVDDGRIAATERRIRARAAEIAAQRGVGVAIETIETRATVPMETRMRLLVRAACLALDPNAVAHRERRGTRRDVRRARRADRDDLRAQHRRPQPRRRRTHRAGRSRPRRRRARRDAAGRRRRTVVPLNTAHQQRNVIACNSSSAAPRCAANRITATSAKRRFVREAKTKPIYRLHSVRDQHPGIYEVAEGGVAIAGEVYELTDEQHAHLISTEPPDLYEAPVAARRRQQRQRDDLPARADRRARLRRHLAPRRLGRVQSARAG